MNQQMIDRFWSYVNKTSTCWEWTKCLHDSRYGLFGIGNKKIERTHKIAYRLCVGEIPSKMFVCHTCDNRKCVNPSHLFIGTNYDNVLDMISKKRNSKPPFMGGWNKHQLKQESIEMLGKYSDVYIARLENVDKNVIRRARKQYNIPPFPSQTRFKSGDPHPCWSRRKEVQN